MKKISLLCLFVSLMANSIALAQTGKVAGVVRDAQSGEPLPGVNVVIVGTTTGTTTDIDGYYSIINVTPGIVSVRASFIGYAPVTVENVNVNIDLTTTVDFEIQEETVGLDEVVVTATSPIIQADISGSQRNIDVEEIQAGRYQDANNLVAAQVGVNTISAYEDAPEIRGSNLDESKFLVDGVEQSDPLTNRPYYRVNLDAVQEVKMQMGGFSAEYGNVRSGLISIVTREGGDTYSGSINVQYSPPSVKHFGPMMFGFDSPIVKPFVDPDAGAFTGVDINGNTNTFFAGWNEVASDEGKAGPHLGKPMELYARWLWRHRSKDALNELKRLQSEGLVNIEWGEGVDPDEQAFNEYGVRPDYSAKFTLGGPLPLLNRVKFFLSYDQTQTEYAYRASNPTYLDRHLRTKFTTNLAQGIKLNLHGLYAVQEGGGGGEGPGLAGMIRSNPFGVLGATNKLWYPHCATPAQQTRQIYGGKLTHTLSANTFYEIDFIHRRTDYTLREGRRNTTPVQGGLYEGQTNLNEGLIGTTEQANARAEAGEYGWQNWRDWAKIKIGEYWYDEAPRGHVPINWRDITGEYRYGSCKTRFNDTYSRSYNFSTDITSQVNRNHQLKAGAQLNYDHVYARYEWVGASTNSGTIEEVDGAPWTAAVYAQDKIEFKGLIANVGIRVDGILHDKYPVLSGNPEDATSGPYSEYLLPGKSDSLDVSVPMKRISDIRVSPRLGLSFPISTVAKIFLNYGHFYQWPEIDQTYRRMRDMANGGRVDRYGNPMLEPARTIAYEVGYEHNLFNMMSLTLTGYYKDINNEFNTAQYYPLGYGGGSYDFPVNMNFRDVRGLEAVLELRRGIVPYVSGWGSVNYLVESGGRFGFDRFFEDPNLQPREVSTEVSNPDVRPIVRLNLDIHTPEHFGPEIGGAFSLLGGINMNLLYTWRRGSQFTWNPDGIPYVEDNIRWRPYQRWDLRFSKDLVSIGGTTSIIYVDVTNLFNTYNMTGSGQNWAWDGHRWWKNEFRNYMESLDLEVRQDGSIKGKDRPGDYPSDWPNQEYVPVQRVDNLPASGQAGSLYFDRSTGKYMEYADGAFREADSGLVDKVKKSKSYIAMPGFTPWTFLEARNVYFGIKFYF